MAAAASACSFDWRSGLGIVRSDLDWFTPAVRAKNYARLSQLTGQSSQMPASIGAAALLAGEKKVGYRFLHDYLVRIPKQSIPIANGFVSQFPSQAPPVEMAEELLKILPDSLLSRAEVAEDFSQKPNLLPIAKQLASKIDLDDLIVDAEKESKSNLSAKPWLLVAWLAKERLETKTQIEALINATIVEPLNHEMRFGLAELLSANGRKDEAIEQAERASRHSPETRRYRDFLESLR